jgi:hypothetical protein
VLGDYPKAGPFDDVPNGPLDDQPKVTITLDAGALKAVEIARGGTAA